MDGLEIVIARLQGVHIVGELWVNGSFVTEKINPNDVDLVLVLDRQFVEQASPEQMEALMWLNENLRDSLRCDTYTCTTDERRSYWQKIWGHDRAGNQTGFAVIELVLGDAE